MKILMITGSPHKKGTTNVLADEFTRGAVQAGHSVYRFDAARKKVHPCIACNRCHDPENEFGCVFKDDMTELNPQLINADAVVFVTPIYYSAETAQIKAVVDRFFANDASIHDGKKAALMIAMSNPDATIADGVISSFKSTCGYLGWDVAGVIAASGCPAVNDIVKTDFPNQAFELGKNI